MTAPTHDGPEHDGFARPLSLAEIEGGQREILERDHRLAEAMAGKIPAPENHGYVHALTAVAELTFGSRVFRVPPIPYPAGVELQHLRARLDKMRGSDESDPAVKASLLEIFEVAVHVMWHLIEPVSLWDRLVWRWRANPFLHASAGEIGELLGFFCGCQMRSRVRHPNRIAPPFLRHRMSRTTPRWSRATSPPTATSPARTRATR